MVSHLLVVQGPLVVQVQQAVQEVQDQQGPLVVQVLPAVQGPLAVQAQQVVLD